MIFTASHPSAAGMGSSGGSPLPSFHPAGVLKPWKSQRPFRHTSARRGFSSRLTKPSDGAKTPLNFTPSAFDPLARKAEATAPSTTDVTLWSISKVLLLCLTFYHLLDIKSVRSAINFP